MLCAKLRSAVSQVSADSKKQTVSHTLSFGHLFKKELFLTLKLHTFSFCVFMINALSILYTLLRHISVAIGNTLVIRYQELQLRIGLG